MPISPIHLSRISNALRTNLITDTVRRTQREVLLTQTRIATGRSFVSSSEDPIAASRTLDLGLALERQSQFSRNLQHADNTLAAADSAISEVSGLVSEARTIASQDVSNLTSADERAADAELIAGIRGQLQSVGNRQFLGRYLFAGRDTTARPFVDVFGGVAYLGDTGDLFTRVDDRTAATVNVPGNVLFGALSARIPGTRDLTPSLTESTRLDDLRGANGNGVRLGTLILNEQGGAGVISVDLAGADTIGDVVRRINEEAAASGSTLSASLSDQGIEIIPGRFPVTVTDTSTGVIGSDLGVLTTQPTTSTISGMPLFPRLTPLTPVSALAGGTAFDLDSGLLVTNGEESATIDLSAAETVQDILNAINNSGLYVTARINEEGTSIDLFNQVSGTVLTIGENGGTTATDLGLRTLTETTSLASLNFGRGISTTPGEPDLRIIASNGEEVEVSLADARTIGDVINLLNTAATDGGVDVTASLLDTGNGIRLVDNTTGSGTLSVTSVGNSTTASDLGFIPGLIAQDGELIGEDRSGIRPEGVLGALVDLEFALRQDDTRGIALAAARLDTFLLDVTRVHGVVGARSQAMRAKLEQTGDAARTTEVFLSEVRDLDYADAITRLQASQTQLQANLQTSSVLLNLSLLDFLR